MDSSQLEGSEISPTNKINTSEKKPEQKPKVDANVKAKQTTSPKKIIPFTVKTKSPNSVNKLQSTHQIKSSSLTGTSPKLTGNKTSKNLSTSSSVDSQKSIKNCSNKNISEKKKNKYLFFKPSIIGTSNNFYTFENRLVGMQCTPVNMNSRENRK